LGESPQALWEPSERASGPGGRYFADPAPEFDPLSSAPMRGTAPLLEGAIRQLGAYTSELSALKPKIEACKKGSFLSALSSHA
jgi:hypothetical protein